MPVLLALTNSPVAVSTPSLNPSPSVSALVGSVPVSLALTQIPVPVSTPSLSPSPSVSGLCGSVPFRYSWRLLKPSLSGSREASDGSIGFNPWAASQRSGIPSLSVSPSSVFGAVPCASAPIWLESKALPNTAKSSIIPWMLPEASRAAPMVKRVKSVGIGFAPLPSTNSFPSIQICFFFPFLTKAKWCQVVQKLSST